MGENNYLFSFFTDFIFHLIVLILFIYNPYRLLLDEICISFFMLFWLQFLNILILFFINMKEKDNDQIFNDIDDKTEINNEYKNEDNKLQNNITKVKCFSYGLILSALFTFFISGGINSFLFIILFCLIINNNFLILKEKNLLIEYIFIIFCYSILSLRANFIDLIYTIIFFVNYKNILYKKYMYINLILNIFFLINFNYFNFILLTIGILSFILHFNDKNIKTIEKNNNRKNEEKKEDKKNEEKSKKYELNFSTDGKIYILNFLILSTLFIQTKGYECKEILIIFGSLLFQMLIILIKKKILMETMVYALPIIFFISIDYYFIENKFYNQKGIWINILYYFYYLIF